MNSVIFNDEPKCKVPKDKFSVQMYHDLFNDPEDYEMCGPVELIESDLQP